MEITDRALELLAAAVDQAQGSEGAAVRLVARAEGWAMELDQPRATDETYEHGERTVLVLDAGAAKQLQDRTLDARDTPEGPKLRLR